MTTFALTALALGVLVLRSGILARWQGFVGIGCGVLVLGAVAALVGAYTVPVAILWSICTAVAVWRGPRGEDVAVGIAPVSEPSAATASV